MCPSENKMASRSDNSIHTRSRSMTDYFVLRPKTSNFLNNLQKIITWKIDSHTHNFYCTRDDFTCNLPCTSTDSNCVDTVWSLFTYNKYLLVFWTNTRFFIIIWFVWSFHFNTLVIYSTHTTHSIIHFSSFGSFSLLYFLFLLFCLFIFCSRSTPSLSQCRQSNAS